MARFRAAVAKAKSAQMGVPEVLTQLSRAVSTGRRTPKTEP
jgi:hypothetical protein